MPMGYAVLRRHPRRAVIGLERGLGTVCDLGESCAGVIDDATLGMFRAAKDRWPEARRIELVEEVLGVTWLALQVDDVRKVAFPQTGTRYETITKAMQALSIP